MNLYHKILARPHFDLTREIMAIYIVCVSMFQKRIQISETVLIRLDFANEFFLLTFYYFLFCFCFCFCFYCADTQLKKVHLAMILCIYGYGGRLRVL